MYRGILNQLALLILLSSVVCTRPVSPPMMRFSAGSHSHSACSSSFGNVILAHACMVFEQEHCSGPTRMQGHEKQANKKPSSYTWSERAGPARRYRARRGLSKQKMADWWQSKYERQRLMRIFILRGRGCNSRYSGGARPELDWSVLDPELSTRSCQQRGGSIHEQGSL